MAKIHQVFKENQWQKGQSGNPGGKPRLPEELKGINSLSQHEVTKLISKHARLPYQELKEFLLDAANPSLELAIASVLEKGIEKGDFLRISFLLDRAIGRVKDIIQDDDTDEELERLRSLPMRQLLTLIQNTLPEEPTDKD